jgi:uncharacterized membrane protein YhhN
MSLLKNKIAFTFLFFTLLECAGIICNNQLMQYIAKPLLLPVLIALLVYNTGSDYKDRTLIIIALIFSWLGDVFLMLDNRNSLFFIIGLICFLTTHIFYIVYFLRIQNNNISLLKKYPLLPLLVVIYGIALVWLLFSHLGDLTLPVIVYATVICTMLISSQHIFLKVPKPANIFFLSGALLFVLSDSLLAINKFYGSFTNAGIAIMLTYCTAQYAIVNGFINNISNDESGIISRVGQ